MTMTSAERMRQERIAKMLDSIEVYDNGELEGFALVKVGERTPLTPVRCCRTCAWADLANVHYAPGFGLVHMKP